MAQGNFEDFRGAINEINSDDDSDGPNLSGDEGLSDGTVDSDMAEFQCVMAIPAPEAPAHVLCAALGKAQQAYRKAWKDAQTAKQELATLTAKLSP
ncbi:hypothetical protein PAXRUDRAFT_16310 [Paxillus rubicundulus Ve08.2h10]|uniref:Unplaced genomic scaffold scaffold_1448, whole genome shotgun sequence n=1 Tax=Paxillus rubicundulus Ve08.2h10 TaxID=930991 RepID=A0A0D0CVM2_9AGAM|nr:hypothetical protein PAXRUDRAFT_16310 [Paxillus rubicundulus Ve08.2h10]